MTAISAPVTEAADSRHERSAVTARCVLIEAAGQVRPVVVLRYDLETLDRELVIRGLLACGWRLVAAPTLLELVAGVGPLLVLDVDEFGAVTVSGAAGDAVFAGFPEDPVTTRWVRLASSQGQVPVLLGIWGVDLGNDVDLAQCARSGKLLAAAGHMSASSPSSGLLR